MEYPFGRYHSPKLLKDILVTTVTGFPYLYQIENPDTREPMAEGTRYNLQQLEQLLQICGYQPVKDSDR